MKQLRMEKTIKEMTLYELNDFTCKEYEKENDEVEVILKRPNYNYEIHQKQLNGCEGWTNVTLVNAHIEINWQALGASISVDYATEEVLDFLKKEIVEVSNIKMLSAYYRVNDEEFDDFIKKHLKKHKAEYSIDVEYFKDHHSDDLLNAVDKAYRIWYRFEFKKSDDDTTKIKLVNFLLEKCYFTNKDLYTLLALEVLNVWIKKADFYYDSNRCIELRHIINYTSKENDFGDVKLSLRVELKSNLPEKVEEYLTDQSKLTEKYFTEVVVTE